MTEQRLQAAQKSTAVPGDIVQGDGQTLERVLLALCKAFDIDSTEHKTLRDTIEAIKEEQAKALQYERVCSAKITENAIRASQLALSSACQKAFTYPNALTYQKLFSDYIPQKALEAPAALELLQVCVDLAVFLMEKNIAYGDSALNPLRAISKADPVEQIRVRMDDKLSRLIRGQAAGEDALKDLVGYWVLLQVLEKRNGGT